MWQDEFRWTSSCWSVNWLWPWQPGERPARWELRATAILRAPEPDQDGWWRSWCRVWRRGYPVLNSYYVSGSVLSFFPAFLHLAHQNDLWGGYCPCFADGEMISRGERFGSLTGGAEIHGQSSWVQVPMPHPLTPTVWRRQGEKWRVAQCLPGSVDKGWPRGAQTPHIVRPLSPGPPPWDWAVEGMT